MRNPPLPTPQLPYFSYRRWATSISCVTCLFAATMTGGCWNPFDFGSKGNDDRPTIQAANQNGIGVVELRRLGTIPSGEVEWIGGPFELHGARNEWLDGLLQVTDANELRISKPAHVASEGELELSRIRVYRVAEVAVETRSIGAVRDGGIGDADSRRSPRALIPLSAIESKEGSVWKIPPGTRLIYLELKAPASAPAGLYETSLEVRSDKGDQRVPFRLLLDDLALSDVPDFSLYGQVTWDDLMRLFPAAFKGIEPRLLTRRDGKHVLATERMDQIVRLAREHRLDIGFDRLSPTVKNTPREGLSIDWSDYDSVVIPWLTGEIDPAREGLGAFPLPLPVEVTRGAVDAKEFARAAMSHFEQQRLLSKMLLPTGLAESALGNSELAAKVRRPGDIVELPAQSEEGLRQVAWLAFAEGRRAARAGNVAPGVSGPMEAETANRAVWFYPGEWFGRPGTVPGVVPSIAIKWARRAQQDREIFELARRRGASTLAQTVARRATRYGERAPTFGGDLLTPSSSRDTWKEGLRIVRAAAVARLPGSTGPSSDMEADEREALQRWSVSLDRPLLLPGEMAYGREEGRITVRAEFDLVDEAAEVNVLHNADAWTRVSASRRAGGMTVRGIIDPARIRYPVNRTSDLKGQSLPPNGSMILQTVSGPQRITAERELLLPVVAVLPSPTNIVLDGKMGDWSEEEVIQFGPLVRMLDRQAVQESKTFRASKSTGILAKWDDNNLYLAIRAEGTAKDAANIATNFTAEDKGRAYGEELCRLMLKGLGGGGKELQLLIKPSGMTVEKGAGQIRYAATNERSVWRAEICIPATALGLRSFGPQVPIEFNLIRHDPATGESSSFAGPIDQDTQPTRGLLILSESAPTQREP